MRKKLFWVAAIMLAAVLYLFENNAGTLTAAVGVLVVPVFGLIPLAGKGIDVEIAVDPAQEKGKSAKGQITVTNLCWLPKPRLGLTLRCRNLRTGETAESKLEISLLPKQKQTVEFSFDCPHCGKMELEVAKVSTADLFGLFSRKLPARSKAEFTVLPQLFEPSISLEHSDMAMPDSDTYSPYKPGSDPGETFAIREYVPGDAIRQIHWKLSEKTDKLMVREFGLPVVNEVALLLETAGSTTGSETDAVTEVFASISSALAAADIHHHVFWRDEKTDELVDFDVTDGDAFSGMLSQLLELPPKEGNIAHRFSQMHPHCPYTHVILVGGQIPQGMRDLYNGNRVSVLIPRNDTVAEGLQPDGTYVLTFDPGHYALDLCRLEV